MNPTPYISLPCRALLAAALFGPLGALAQVTPPATPAVVNVPVEQETIVLSPFVVRSDEDTFAPATVMAGGRLATRIQDAPIAYSVVTQEMIQALGLVDLNAAMEWTTNTIRFPDGAGGGDTFNLTVPINVRGVGNVGGLRQRNFFIYFGENDSYSIERFDFGRGPNQVLFGNGTIGGTQVSMTKRARFGRNSESIEVGYGSWDNKRVVVDANYGENEKVALRTSLLWADRDGWRDNEMEKRQAAFLTGTVKLFKDVEFRIEGEFGEIQRRTPDAKLTDRLGGWDGVTTGNFLATLPSNSGALGINTLGANYFVLNGNGGNTIYNYTGWAITRGAGDTNTTLAGDFVQGALPAWNQNTSNMLNSLNVVPDRFKRAIANSQFRLPSRDFTNAPNSPLIDSDFKDLQATLSKQIGKNLFLELAGDVNVVQNDIDRMEGGAITTQLDINPNLPNGAVNPNFLKPYGDGQIFKTNTDLSARSVRAAAAYILDLDKWGNWSFNVMGGLTNQLRAQRNRVLATGINNTTQLADPRNWADVNFALRQRLYWGDGGAVTIPTGPIAYVNNLGVASTTTPVWVPMQGADSTNNISDNDADYNYVLVAANAKFFKGRLVLLGAARYDDSKVAVRYLKRIGDYSNTWDLQSLLWRPDAPADWGTLMYTPIGSSTPVFATTRIRTANAAGIQEANPAYANVRFADDFNPPPITARGWNPSTGAVFHATNWLSVFGNYAEAFSFNTTAAPDVNGRLLPVVIGTGWDAGFRVQFFNGKLNLAATTYENKENGNYIDPTSVTNQINTLYQANPLGNTTVGGRNSRNAADINGLVRDTRTRVGKGYELEVVANLAPGWRLTANMGLPDVTESNYGPLTRAYVEANDTQFRQILDDAGGTVGSDGIAVRKAGVADTGNAPNESLGNEAQRAVNAYNTLYSNLRNFVINERPLTTSPKNANIFTDYTIQAGRLKGLRLGAGVNWRGSRVVGYRGGDTIVNPANPLTAIDNPNVDGYTPIYAPGASLVTATLGYTWKFKQGRSLNVNLRVSNVLNEDAVIWTDTTTTLRPLNSDFTSPARETVLNPYAYQTPRSYYLTTKFTF